MTEILAAPAGARSTPVDLSSLVNLDDFEAAARARLSRFAYLAHKPS